mmetsp:Transcript_22377/g.29012  ORF Transcript_22377/g.29012 Transcript_22377/m.29012 type:complete len:1105 (-) Transcript_22377:185-3499(-)|eukprot:CAMPEP_0117739446 /NCGR_PEP_ID=MMETSP0947-20121206/3751_1 /TAXON_ID=44440 /ORGANISM="Chattonella subsalsa, Strain CCMP2191" /LENGTH=1104 /DNA_ID=CAMNT_0005555371 /DNA_START=205 /DNA_END=3519 /DNA_ORIENTATION=+
MALTNLFPLVTCIVLLVLKFGYADIVVLSPDASSVFYPGQPVEVSFEYDYLSGQTVTFSLYKDGAEMRFMTEFYAPSGQTASSNYVILPSVLPSGTDYVIWVKDLADGSTIGISEEFEVVAEQEVVCDFVSILQYDYWGDGWDGNTFSLIDEGTSNIIQQVTLADGYFDQTCLNVESGSCYSFEHTSGGSYPVDLAWVVCGVQGTYNMEVSFCIETDGSCSVQWAQIKGSDDASESFLTADFKVFQQAGVFPSLISATCDIHEDATLSNCDDCLSTKNIGFDFHYALDDTTYSQVTISSNGCIFLGETGNDASSVHRPANEDPTCGAFWWPDQISFQYPVICPFFTDLSMGATVHSDGTVSVASCEEEFVVKFEDVGHLLKSGCTYNFEVALSREGAIEFRYFDMCEEHFDLYEGGMSVHLQGGNAQNAINICGPDCSCWDGMQGNYRVLFETGPPAPPSKVSVVSFDSTLVVAFEDEYFVEGNTYTVEYESYTGFGIENPGIHGSIADIAQPGIVEIEGVVTENMFYKVTVTTVLSSTGEVSAPSEAVIVKAGTSECPSPSDDLWGEIAGFNTEDNQGREQFTLVVPYNLNYIASADCESCDYSGGLMDVSFQLGTNPSCTILVNDEFADSICADVFRDLGSCGGWGFVRMDFLLDGLSVFDLQPIGTDDEEVVYSATYTTTGTFEAESVFAGSAPSRSETQIRTVALIYPRSVETDLTLSSIYGEPIKEIFPVSLIEVTDQGDDGPNGFHSLTITTRTQYPYVIIAAQIADVSFPSRKYAVTINTQDCSLSGEGDACEQVVTISTTDGSGFPFPDCDDELTYALDLTMNCIELDDGTVEGLNCDVDIPGGCTFSVSTDFCPALTITAENVGAQLKTYSDVATVDINGATIYMTEDDKEQSAFAYLNTIYYEMSLSGLTGSDVTIESVVITDERDGSQESFTILTNEDIFELDNTTPWIFDYETDGVHTSPIPVFVLKNFNSDHREDTIIFKQYVHENTFPNYPSDDTEPLVNYVVTCTVVNNGFQRKLEYSLRFGASLERTLSSQSYAGKKNIGIGARASGHDDEEEQNDIERNPQVNSAITTKNFTRFSVFSVLLAFVMMR